MTNDKQQPVQTDVLPTERWTEKEHKAIELGKAAMAAGKEFADKFRNFAIFARNNLEPKRIAAVLVEAGFSSRRASDIKAICMAPKEVFDAYQKKQIGWKPTIEATRQERATKRGKSRKNTFSDSTGKMSRMLDKMKCQDISYLEAKTLGLVIFPLQAGSKSFKSANGFEVTVDIIKL